MRRTIWLSLLAAVVLAVGGCKQQEKTPPAPQPAPIVASQPEQEKTAQVQPPPPVPPAPKKTAPVEATKVAPPATVKPAPAAVVPSVPAVKPAATSPAAPKTVTFTATNGNVTFDHLQHSGNNACSSCHPSEPPTKIVLDKDKAHQLCKGCHQEKGAGPTQCSGCHKKG